MIVDAVKAEGACIFSMAGNGTVRLQSNPSEIKNKTICLFTFLETVKSKIKLKNESYHNLTNNLSIILAAYKRERKETAIIFSRR